MRILSVVSEIYPLIKTGGLADVMGALPLALERLGITMKSLIPGYPCVIASLGKTVERHAYTLLGTKARILEATVEGLPLYVLEAPELYDRPGGPYSDASGVDHADNWRRFGALAKAGADIGGGLLSGFVPDLVHSHDWQAAMAAAYMRYAGINRPSIVTIHNLAFQGQFPSTVFGGLDLPPEAFSVEGVEYYGGIGFLKAGLQNAWAITTVSPTYAQEIRTPAFGMGLDGLIAGRSAALCGIVNGIDGSVWDPETDAHLIATFSPKRLQGRVANRQAIEARFSLDADCDPLLCVVSRLTLQKGMDLLAEVGDDLVAAGAKLAVLGTGDASLAGAFLSLAARHRGRIGVVIGYDEALAHRMQGGGDAIVIPSRFEPCGLTQLYGLRYGCVPVVARVGGLADTVIDANTAALKAGVATGVQFSPVDANSLRDAIRRTVALFRSPDWAVMQRRGMRADVSWNRSAALYAELYRTLVPNV
ncbi:MAG: glycogen synthase GlgA, partial [Nitrococcus sp.]|nr:glycogen synthase GlgA [Nitrococcus sp.]